MNAGNQLPSNRQCGFNNRFKDRTLWSLLREIFCVSALLILSVSVLAKLISASQGSRDLTFPDPLFPFMTKQELMLVACAAEMAVIAPLVISTNSVLTLISLASLSSCFALYRLGVAWLGSSLQPCPCLGNAATWLGVRPAVSDHMSNGLMLYLLLVSILFLSLDLLSNASRRKNLNSTILGALSVVIVLLFAVETSVEADAEVQTAAPSKPVFQPSFECEGSLQYLLYNSSGLVRYKEHKHFHVWVNGDNQWCVRITPESDDYSPFSCVELASDGSDIYRMEVFNTNYTNIIVPSANGIAPGFDPSFASEVWLAYASGNYLMTRTNTYVKALWPVGDLLNPSHGPKLDSLVSADWKLSSEPPYVPLEVVYYTPTSRNDDGAFEPPSLKEKPDAASERTNALYRVSKSTNIAGITLPIEFQLLRFGKFRRESSSPLSPIVEIAGIADRVHLASTKRDLIPVLPGKTTVDDYRGTNSGVAVKYIDRKWRALSSVEELRTKHIFSPRDKPRRLGQVKRAIIYLLIFSLASIPVIVWVRAKRMQRR